MSFEKLWEYDASNPFWFARMFRNFRAPLPVRRSVEVLPGVYSFDDTFLKFLRELSNQLNDHPGLTPTLDRNMMVGQNAIHTSFDRIRTVAGYASSPLSYPAVNNNLICEELGIPKDFRSERHRQIFDELMDITFGSWKPTAIKVPKHSTNGFPMQFVYDASYKREYTEFLFENIDDILSTFRDKNFEKLASEYGILFLFNLNRRGQVDEPGKVRMSNDLEYAISGGLKGKQVQADKSVKFDDGRTYDDFSATRERVVQGASWAINSILQVIASGHMYALFDQYPEVFHHTDPNKIAVQASEFGDATFSDVSNYDASMREFLIRRMMSVAKKYWQDELIDMSELLYYAPYYARPLGLDGESRGVIVGDPMNPYSTPVNAGNRSGHAWTSLVAKVIKVYDSLTVADDIFGDVLGNVHGYLKWRNPIKLVNNGDDEGALGSKEAVAAYRVARYSGNHGYFKVDPEKGQGFSGSLMVWSGQSAGQAIPRLHTVWEKLYVPERGIGGVFRPRWPIGVLTRLEALTKHPSGGIADEIHRKLWHDIMRPKYGSFSDLLIAGMNGLDLEYDGLNAMERELLDDPSKMHHRYIGMDNEISDAVMDKIAVRIQPEEFPWAFDKYSGRIL